MKFNEATLKFLVEAEEAPKVDKNASKNTLEIFLKDKNVTFDSLLTFIEEHPESNIQKEKVIRILQEFSKFFEEGNYAAWKRKTGKGDEAFDLDQIEMGIKVEKEHTSDPLIARKICMDHLAEDAEYYTKLKKAEL
jgi:hypothetical protein